MIATTTTTRAVTTTGIGTAPPAGRPRRRPSRLRPRLVLTFVNGRTPSDEGVCARFSWQRRPRRFAELERDLDRLGRSRHLDRKPLGRAEVPRRDERPAPLKAPRGPLRRRQGSPVLVKQRDVHA